MKNLILVKLGGSVITDKSKPFTARTNVISRLGKKIKKEYMSESTDLIIGHGGGSFPHVPASKYQTQKGLIGKNSVWGFCLTADAAIEINRIVVKELLKLKMNVASFAPMSFMYEGKILNEHFKKAFSLGIIPVIYGDTALDEKQGFHISSTEVILDRLAKKFAKYYKKITILYFTDTNGVYDNKGKTIEKITPKNFSEIKKYLTGSGNVDVTGGMIHKVKESLDLVKKLDAEVYIMNGLSRGKITKICRS